MSGGRLLIMPKNAQGDCAWVGGGNAEIAGELGLRGDRPPVFPLQTRREIEIGAVTLSYNRFILV
jgi:hypothetical protein